MKNEFEVKFYIKDHENFRDKLRELGATLVHKESLYKRLAFHLPSHMDIKKNSGWGRIRDEGDKVTISIKIQEGEGIDDQKEICLQVDSFEVALEFFNLLGFKEKAYQETKREQWEFNGADISIDTWPFLDPFVEIEAGTVAKIKDFCERMDMDFEGGMVGPVTNLYSNKYGVPADEVNNNTPIIVFNMKNPFLK